MDRSSYSVFDHTADIGLEVTAPSPEALYETAARALFETLTDISGVNPRESRSIVVTGADPEELLVRWLSELLSLHDAEGLLFSSFQVLDLSSRRLRGTACGEAFEPGRHEIRTEVKAVTYHQVSVREDGGLWKARLVLDV